jgi:hypothetical protein
VTIVKRYSPLVMAALAIALAMVLFAVLSGGGSNGTAPAQAKVNKGSHHRVHHARKHHKRTHARSTENESSSESEGSGSEPAGEPTPGHEDPAGQNADHQCPPSCDTANGEQP